MDVDVYKSAKVTSCDGDPWRLSGSAGELFNHVSCVKDNHVVISLLPRCYVSAMSDAIKDGAPGHA
jgi:hypothetical protein